MKAIISARFLASHEARPTTKPFEVWDRSLRGFILRVQPTGVRAYVVQVSRGRRVTIGVDGPLTPTAARLRAEKVLGNVANQLAPLHGLDGSNQTSFGEFIEFTYTPWAEANRPKTWKYTIGRLKRCYGKWYRYNLKEITVELIENWKTAKLRAGMRPATVHRDIAGLSAVLTRAVKLGKIDDNPVRRVDKPRIDRNPKVRFLSSEEECRLRSALQVRDLNAIAARKSANQWRVDRGHQTLPELPHFADHLTPAVLVSMNTGLRRGELLALTWSAIDLVHQFLTVAGESAKAGHTRHIPLNDEALDVLRKWKAQSSDKERVFPINTGFKSAWGQLLAAAPITVRFRWHDLRHHFASRLAQAGVPLNTIRELLGHGSMAMTLRYAHLAPDQKKDAVAKLIGVGLPRNGTPSS